MKYIIREIYRNKLMRDQHIKIIRGQLFGERDRKEWVYGRLRGYNGWVS